jgi:MraZ protein
MENLYGTYECKIDAKGRLLLPALLKKQLAPYLADGFILKRSIFEECLELYTMQEWRNVTDELRQKSRFKRKNMTFFRRFTAGVKPIDLDGTGRMLVTKDLVSYAGIKKRLY